jgi:hypothetical protein
MHFGKAVWAGFCIGMVASVVGTPACAAMHGLHLFPKAQVTARKMSLGDWRLRVETSSFSGDTSCHLEDRRHRISYVAGALGFRFGSHVNISGAWVRVDDGAPTRWQDDLPELTWLGVPLEPASLDNPTDGIVWLPADRLEGAGRIAIQTDERKRPVTYTLNGFAKLRDAARTMGCAPERRFVR